MVQTGFKKKHLIVISGPTASGKTGFSVKLAEAIGERFGVTGEIVCADSMQIYEKLLIGTARPSVEEMRGIPHHLFGFLPIDEVYSVAQYVALARKTFEEIWSRGNLPILCGGTGLYINSVIDNINFLDNSDDGLREELIARLDSEGVLSLYEQLKGLDPQGAEEIHPNNEGRVVRALETVLLTGLTRKEQAARSKDVERDFTYDFYYVNYKSRSTLYERINQRVDIMLESGLMDEVREIGLNWGGSTASQAIGYKELIPFVKGERSLEDCVDDLKQATRRYAKRQMTWFRKRMDKTELFADEHQSVEEMVEKALESLKLFD